MRYGATRYEVFRSRDDRYKFLHVDRLRATSRLGRVLVRPGVHRVARRLLELVPGAAALRLERPRLARRAAPRPTSSPTSSPDASTRCTRPSTGPARAVRGRPPAARHWRALAGRLDAVGPRQAPPLVDGLATRGELLAELTAACAGAGCMPGRAAQGLGRASPARCTRSSTRRSRSTRRCASRCSTRARRDAARLPRRLAARRGDAELAALLDEWAARMRVHEDALRAAAIALGRRPDAAIKTATPGLAGRAGHGRERGRHAGEWVDGRLRR